MKTTFSAFARQTALFFVKLAAATAFCILFAFAFVYPLWLFATKTPNLFSAVVAVLFCVFAAAAFIFKIKTRTKDE